MSLFSRLAAPFPALALAPGGTLPAGTGTIGYAAAFPDLG